MSIKLWLLATSSFYKNTATPGYKPEGEIEVFRDLPYGEDKKCILDVYRPKSDGKIPVIVNFHGDMLARGVKEHRRNFCMRFADMGYAVVNVEQIRPSSAGGFEVALNKTRASLEWLVAHADEYGIDARKTVLCGDGIGALIAFSLALASVEGLGVVGVMGYSGIYDVPELFAKDVSYNLHYDVIKELFGISGKQGFTSEQTERIRLTSLTKRVTTDYPPVFIAHSVRDGIAPGQGTVMSKALRAKGVPVSEFKAVYAPCGHNFQLDKSPYAMRTYECANEFLRAVFYGTESLDKYIEV